MMSRILLTILAVTILPFAAYAAEEAPTAGEGHPPYSEEEGLDVAGHGETLPEQHWHFDGLTGTYDRAALQRGLKIYREVCSACHSMNRLYFRNLEALGYDENQTKNIAAEYTVMDGPNDEGEMFERPGRPSDRFPAPYPNEQAAKFANNGALPPDLSLIVKARQGGADYVYAILTGYEEPPPGTELLQGQHWNKYMPGNVIAMAPPLADGMVAYEDDAPQTLEQYAKDVTQFLKWASEPYMEERKRTGLKAILFLAVFALIMYAYKRRLWENVH